MLYNIASKLQKLYSLHWFFPWLFLKDFAASNISVLQTSHLSKLNLIYSCDIQKWKRKEPFNLEILIKISFIKLVFYIYLYFIWKINENIAISRSSHHRCSVRKGVLRNFAKFTGKHLPRACNFIKKRLWQKRFPVNYEPLDDCFWWSSTNWLTPYLKSLVATRNANLIKEPPC